jgi:hypothetical protein
VLLLFNNSFVFPQDAVNKSYADLFEFVEFSGDKIIFKEEKNQEISILKTGYISMEPEYNIPFINVNYDSGDHDKLLLIRNDDICALLDDKNLVFWGISGGINRREGFLPPSIVKATSFLIENNIVYSPENLTKYPKLDNPWCEGVEGQGVGEKLYIQRTLASALHISIGFVSYNKPYLYNMNSRPKDLHLSVEGKFSFTHHLLDTPNYQKISFPQRIEYDDTLVVEILSVYEGIRYQDTCINNIIIQMF